MACFVCNLVWFKLGTYHLPTCHQWLGRTRDARLPVTIVQCLSSERKRQTVVNWPWAATTPGHRLRRSQRVYPKRPERGLWAHMPKVWWARTASTQDSRNSTVILRTIFRLLRHRLLTPISDTVSWGLAFDHMTPGASLDSDHSTELKVSSWEGPLETYSWLLSRWRGVFKELLHSNRIRSPWLYLLLSQENGRKKNEMFVPGVVHFILPGWPGIAHSLTASN